eukprot:1719914-Amphidinium_carterae.1
MSNQKKRKKNQHRLLLLRETRTHFRQVLVERTNLQHRPMDSDVVSTKRRTNSTLTTTASSIISKDNYHDTASTNKTG